MFEKCKILNFYESRNSRCPEWTGRKNAAPLSSVKYYKVCETQLIIFVVDTDTPAKEKLDSSFLYM